MRYLYGDSAPFPLHYDFLSTLETFVTSAAKAVELDALSRAAHKAASDAATTRAQSVEGLERFHTVVMRALRDTSSRSMEALTVDYARQLSDNASRIVDDARRSAAQSSERELSIARGDAERRRVEIRSAVEAFFKVGRLPTVETKVTLQLGEGREPRNVLSSVLTIAEGIIAGYTLSTDTLPDWQHPRKVFEFAPGIQLLVGAKKSWFKKTIEPEMVNLDDYFVSGFELSDDDAEIRLRKKPEAVDSLVFRIKRVESNLIAEVHHPDDAEAEGQLSSTVDANDRVQLERLWQLLRSGVSSVLEHRAHVVSIHLDGEEVFENDKVVPLVERIMKMLAPTVSEIAKRSPNPQELSLKVEKDDGRREEIYLKKEVLLSKLVPLQLAERQLFSGLGLGLGPGDWYNAASV